jgi:trans-aconitate methyltransferase
MPIDRATRRFYETHAAAWERRHPNPFHSERQFSAFASLLPQGSAVLDIGCAAGIHVPMFLGIGHHLRYTGLDVSSAFLKTAHRRYPHLPFLQGDISDPKTLPKKKFHGFWASSVLMHVPREDWPALGATITSLMHPRVVGYLCLPVARPTPNPEAGEDPRHFTVFDVKTERALLRSFGWSIQKSGTLDGTRKQSDWRWYIVTLP